MTEEAGRPVREDILPLVRRMQAAEGVREAADILPIVARVLGLNHVAVLFDAAHPEAPKDEFGRNLSESFGWAPGFIEKFLARNLTGRSPSIMRARFELLPFAWTSDEAMPDVEMQAGAQEVLNAMSGAGVTGAIVAPVRMPRGRLGTVGWLGRADAATLKAVLREHGPALLAIAYYFFERLRSQYDLPTVDEDRARLTPREVEFLRAAAGGYSDVEVARMTGLSPHTIRFHHRRAAEKLGARSRTAAVALAIQLGLLGPIA